ncbi:unnamed protein product [Nezara viridula]|uniref:Uncharacterized protein n=1 Tax=Nezara viridula TaxID=85310 RepID=A0A9P0MVS4_NEZVI|nr:unnamed protein product [Nezara viridula]
MPGIYTIVIMRCYDAGRLIYTWMMTSRERRLAPGGDNVARHPVPRHQALVPRSDLATGDRSANVQERNIGDEI